VSTRVIDALSALVLAAADEAARLQAIAGVITSDDNAQHAIRTRSHRWLALADEAVEALKAGREIDAGPSTPAAPSASTHPRGRGAAPQAPEGERDGA
jgi:hypothetical protein